MSYYKGKGKYSGSAQGGFGKQWNYGKGQVYSPCRHEPTPVFEIEGVTYHACSGNKVNYKWEGTLINLKGDTHLVKPKPVVAVSPDWEELLSVSGGDDPFPDTVVVDWKDYQAPPVSREFWQYLHDTLVERQSNPLLYCVGGHGRTGTAMVALMVVSGYTPTVGEALEHIHKHYCEEAVESVSQERYLYGLNGEQMPEKKEKDTDNQGWKSKAVNLWQGWGE